MKGKEKVGYVMKEFRDGKLKSSSGKKVTDRNQAMAIAMSEAGINKKMFSTIFLKSSFKFLMTKLSLFKFSK